MTGRVRRLGGALALVLAPWGFVIANASYGWMIRNGGSDETGAEALALAATGPGILRLGIVAGMIGCLLIIPAVLTALRVAPRSRLAFVGGSLMIAGYVCYFGVLLSNMIIIAMAERGGPLADYAAVIDASQADRVDWLGIPDLHCWQSAGYAALRDWSAAQPHSADLGGDLDHVVATTACRRAVCRWRGARGHWRCAASDRVCRGGRCGASSVPSGGVRRVRVMEERVLGRTERPVSVIGLGTWQLGADWGEVSETAALDVLSAAVESGVTFFDTADVYGDGRSERLIGRFRAENPEVPIMVATKMGRRVDQVPENYTLQNFRAWTDRSRRNLGVDQLDLVQLHCPPTAVYSSDQIYDALDTLVADGVIGNYGVSVQTCDEALTAMSRRGTATVQIILNAFRRKPLEVVLPSAITNGVGIIARVPLASGLLSGGYTTSTRFAENDHRTFNRAGEAFDVGETFSGVDYETGVRAAKEFADLVAKLPFEATPAQAALAWVAQQEGVTTVIPGARTVAQAQANAAAGELPPLGPDFMAGVAALYDRELRAQVHDRW